MVRKVLVPVMAVMVLLAVARPAEATVTPGKVGLVSIYAATTSSLTLRWPHVSYATKYEVLVATNEGMTNASVRSAGNNTTYRVTGLTKGKIYCFAVRARNGTKVGSRSSHTCKEPIRQQGATTGANYGIVTYNLCSEKCSNWSGRSAGAVKLIIGQNPDIVALQEAGSLTSIPGYTNTTYKSAKRLMYRTSRFAVATTDCSDDQTGQCEPTPRTGFIQLSGFCQVSTDCGSDKYAVWAELIDRNSADKHVIFVSVHTTPGKTYAAAWTRKHEIERLLRAMTSINTGGVPVVYAGDFNSHRNRPNDYLASVFHAAGYWDSFELSRLLTRPNYNSYNGFSKTPIISRTWGDHVDHVWVKPAIGVRSWTSVGTLSGGKYVTLPSDHNPVGVKITIP